MRKLSGFAHIEHLSTAVGRLEDRIERERLQFLLQYLVEGRMLFRVQHRVVGEIGWRVRLIGRDERDEVCLAHRLERVVRFALLADRRNGLFTDLLAAKRSRAVGRRYQRVVGQRQQLVSSRSIEQPAQIGGRPAERRPQVWPAHVADKQRVAGQHSVRVGLIACGVVARESRLIRRCGRAFRAPRGERLRSRAYRHLPSARTAYRPRLRAEMDDGAGALSRSSRCPVNKSASKWVRNTWRIVRP